MREGVHGAYRGITGWESRYALVAAQQTTSANFVSLAPKQPSQYPDVFALAFRRVEVLLMIPILTTAL